VRGDLEKLRISYLSIVRHLEGRRVKNGLIWGQAFTICDESGDWSDLCCWGWGTGMIL